ncbi:hypothetical protein PGT21_007357 [Puccinia graminis f. sp. tritici]|uniref:Phospholipid/glycerol acyltransferase domain-containing protein n=1 Tax=Puccinia graminis f. sp. tritici TaxID=56615 RepID=A0A5B0QSK0_PUCGR|nr:hypothetical protein PGT21_007357 [Puccinia graminis f. sp. tritici]
MEKFSTWRDPSTGLAPFVYPLPPLSTIQLPRIAWIPLVPLALFRTALIVVLGLLFVIFEGSGLVVSLFSVKFHSILQYYCTAIFSRITLYLLGFTQLPSDRPFTHRTSSQKLISTTVRPGDLVVCNWSSYVDILYLAYLYNPIFIIPVLKHGAPSQGSEVLVRGFESKGVLGLIFRTGHPPSHNPATKIKSLAQFLQESKRLRRPLIIFPEGTTSNNRALLRCPKLNEISVGKHDGKVKVFCLAIKHETPTPFKNSITVPIPTSPMNLMHMVQANLVPILVPFLISPRSILVRFPRTDFIELDSSTQLVNSFELAFDLISQAAKLKLTSQISCADKTGFLNYLKSRKS